MDLGSSFRRRRSRTSHRRRALRLAGQRQSPFAELLFEKLLVERGQIADLANAELVQVLLGDFADAGDLSHVERREKPRLLTRQHPQHAVRLGLIGGDLGDQARGGDPDRAVQVRAALIVCAANARRRAEGRAGVRSRSCRDTLRRSTPFRPGREAVENFVHAARVIAVAVADGLRRRWRAGRAGRPCAGAWPSARRTCGPRRRRPTRRRARWSAADDHRLALEDRIEQLLDGDEERIHVEVEDDAGGLHQRQYCAEVTWYAPCYS